MILYKLGVRIVVETISNMKLRPIIPKKRAKATLEKVPLATMLSKIGVKKIAVKIANTPVLITGTAIETKIEPTKVFLFLKALKIKPAAIPAKVVLRRHAKIVPTGLTAKKTEIVLGETRTITPQTRPKNPPTIGPYKIAPKQIGISDRLIFANPGWM